MCMHHTPYVHACTQVEETEDGGAFGGGGCIPRMEARSAVEAHLYRYRCRYEGRRQCV